MHISDEFFEAYRPGSAPVRPVTGEEIAAIRALALDSIGPLESDHAGSRFDAFIPWTNRYGVSLSNIDDALRFIHVHEGLHTGFIMALKKTLLSVSRHAATE